MANYILINGEYIPLLGQYIAVDNLMHILKANDKIVIGGKGYPMGEGGEGSEEYKSFPDLGPADCCYVIGPYLYDNNGYTRIGNTEITKLFGQVGITQTGSVRSNGLELLPAQEGPFQDFAFYLEIIGKNHENDDSTSYPGRLKCAGGIAEDGRVEYFNTYIPDVLHRPYKVRKSVILRWSEQNIPQSDLEFDGVTYIKHTVTYYHYAEIFISAEQDTANDIEKGALYIHYFGYEEKHLYYRDIPGAMPILNGIGHFDTETYQKYGNCSYLSTNGAMAVIDGKLYRNTFFDSFVKPQFSKFEIIDDSTSWDWCTGICKGLNGENSAYVWTYSPYAYALKEGRLYINDQQYNYMLLLDPDKIWTNISDYYAPHAGIRTDKETGETYKFFCCIYGVSSGNLYQIKGKTVTAVDTSGDWVKTWGQYDSDYMIYAFALRSDGHLYRIEDTTITDLGHVVNG